MLNIKAHSIAGGSGLARYHWQQAVCVEGEELGRLLMAAVRSDDEYARWDTIEILVEALDTEDHAQTYNRLVTDLAAAVALAKEIGWLDAVEKLRGAIEDPGPWVIDVMRGLRGAFGAAEQSDWLVLLERIAEVGALALDVRAEAERRFDELAALARDPLIIERFGVEYRRDTSDRLAALIGIDPIAVPRLEDLKHLMSGQRADGCQIPWKRAWAPTGTPVGTHEIIFSADKSVSVTWGLASQEEQRLIGRAHRIAVDHAMVGIARQAGGIRSRANGQDVREQGDITWVKFHHKFSRSGDMQLHTHVSILNVVLARNSNEVRSVDNQRLHGYGDVAKEAYHTRLAQELRGLGIEVEMKRVGHGRGWAAAEVQGIDERVLRHFSGRMTEAERHAIDYLSTRHGVDFASLSPYERSAWLTRAAAATRRPMYYVQGADGNTWLAIAEGQGYVPPPQVLDPAHGRAAQEAEQQVEERVAKIMRPHHERFLPHIHRHSHVKRGLWEDDRGGLSR